RRRAELAAVAGEPLDQAAPDVAGRTGDEVHRQSLGRGGYPQRAGVNRPGAESPEAKVSDLRKRRWRALEMRAMMREPGLDLDLRGRQAENGEGEGCVLRGLLLREEHAVRTQPREA